MEPARQQQIFRAFPAGGENDCDDDDDDDSSLTDASDLSFDWEEVEDVNLDSLVPLNSATAVMEAAVVEEGVAEFLQAAPERVADIQCEFTDGLLVADNVMQVTAVETRTCWPLQVVQSSSAAVMLRAPPGRRGTVVITPVKAASRPAPATAAAAVDAADAAAESPIVPEMDLLALLTQPKLVPHNPAMHTVQLRRQSPLPPRRPTPLQRITAAVVSATGLKFHPVGQPPMSRCEKVPYLHGFTFGDTYQLQEKLWLLPQLMCGAMALTGILLILFGIIMLQINKYLVALCASQSEGLQCRTDEESFTSGSLSMGIGTMGGGLTLILICGIVFLHAFCVIYDEGEHHKTKNQENISLHVPTAAYRINLSDLSNSAGQPQLQLQLEASSSRQQQAEQLQQQQQQPKEQPQQPKSPSASGLVRWQSDYDNLNVTDDV